MVLTHVPLDNGSLPPQGPQKGGQRTIADLNQIESGHDRLSDALKNDAAFEQEAALRL
jgi:hypothetical protein